jgi:heme exporter protein C
LAFTVAAVFSILFIVKREKKYDTLSRVGMEATLIFTVGTMLSGTLWTLASWVGGSAASFAQQLISEPRLLTYTVLLLLVIAYFVLRNSVEEDERRAMYSAVYSTISWLSVPISYFAADLLGRWLTPTHPEVFSSGMDPSNLIPFLMAMLGMVLVGYAVFVLRVAEENAVDTLEAIKETIEEQ